MNWCYEHPLLTFFLIALAILIIDNIIGNITDVFKKEKPQ